MPGISPYRRCTGLTFSHLLRYASESRKYVRLFRFPDASRAGDSLISTIKNSPSLRSELFFIVDIDRKTSNTIKTFVFEWYQFLNHRNNGQLTVKK